MNASESPARMRERNEYVPSSASCVLCCDVLTYFCFHFTSLLKFKLNIIMRSSYMTNNARFHVFDSYHSKVLFTIPTTFLKNRWISLKPAKRFGRESWKHDIQSYFLIYNYDFFLCCHKGLINANHSYRDILKKVFFYAFLNVFRTRIELRK